MTLITRSRSVSAFLVAASVTACAQPQQPPPSPPSMPPPAVAPAPAVAQPSAAAPSAGPPPAPAASEAPPAAVPPRRHASFRFAGPIFWAVDSLELRPEQKTVLDGIEADLDKLRNPPKQAREKLLNDTADGIAAGKLDKAKTDADIRALVAAVSKTTPAVQDAANRLHKTLDAEQRRRLVDELREGRGAHHPGMGPGGPGVGGPGMPGPGMRGPGMGGPGGPEMHGPGGGMGPGMHGPGAGMGPGMHGPGGGMGPGMHGPGAGMGMGPPPGGGMGPAGGPLVRLGRELDLTPEQKQTLATKLEAQSKADEAAWKKKLEARRKHLQALADAFQGENFDAKKLGVGSQAPEMAKDMAERHMRFVQTVFGVLTPEQRAKFAEHVRARAAALDQSDDDNDD